MKDASKLHSKRMSSEELMQLFFNRVTILKIDGTLCFYNGKIYSPIVSQQHLEEIIYQSAYFDFVCVDQMGMLLQPDFVSQKFQQLLAKYNLRPIRFHDLRHSCATIMLYLGYTMKDIQTWLGHSNYAFTANTYVHASHAEHQRMAQTFSDRLPALLPTNPVNTAAMPLIEPMIFD